MMKSFDQNKVDEILTRGVAEVIDRAHLEARLKKNKLLKIKLGIDPSSPYIHLGFATLLLKLRDFQNLGHRVVLVIGDFTGQIGDTSDKMSERPMLTEREVRTHMKSYVKQLSMVLDMKRTQIVYNSKWLKKLRYKDIAEQANLFSLSDFISRTNIKKRLDDGRRISLRELIYPLMQGYDSVIVKSDIEVGGTDQRFNLLAGRTMQTAKNMQPQDILMLDLLLGVDGDKMSKSRGNVINLMDQPGDMFGKVMRIADEQMQAYFMMLTRLPIQHISKLEEGRRRGTIHPRDMKMELALEIVKQFKGEKMARAAQEHFKKVFQKNELPEQIESLTISAEDSMNIIEVIMRAGFAKSKSEAVRLIEQGGIRLNEEVVRDFKTQVKDRDVLRRGKRQFIRINLA